MELTIAIIGIILSALVAIFAVFLGARVQLEYLREESERNDIQQRLKLLKLAQQELTLNKEFRERGGNYRSTEFYTGRQLMQYPGFSPDKYQDMLELTLEVMRNFDMLHIAIDTMRHYSNQRQGTLMTPSFSNYMWTGFESMFGKKPTVEAMSEQVNEVTKKVINENAVLLDEACSKLLQLVIDKSIPEILQEEKEWNQRNEKKRKSPAFWFRIRL